MTKIFEATREEDAVSIAVAQSRGRRLRLVIRYPDGAFEVHDHEPPAKAGYQLIGVASDGFLERPESGEAPPCQFARRDPSATMIARAVASATGKP